MSAWLWISVGVLLSGPIWLIVYALCRAAAEPPHPWGHLTGEYEPPWVDAERRRRKREGQ